MATHSREEGERIREEILSRVDLARQYDHVRLIPTGPEPNSPVRVLARRVSDHTVEDEV